MSMSRETTLQKPDEIAILVSTAGPRRLRINSFHYIMLYWIFLSFKHKYQTSNIQEQHLNHVSWGEPNSTFSLQKKHTQEITQRKRSKHSYSSSHCKRPMKYIHIYLYIYTHLSLSSTSHNYNQFKNLYPQDTLTWPADRNYPLVFAIIAEPTGTGIPGEHQDMSRQLAQREMALNNPTARIKAKNSALFKKRLDSFCVGVGQDYCIQTGSEL